MVASGERAPHNLIQTLRSTKTSRASTDDEDVDIAVVHFVSFDIHQTGYRGQPVFGEGEGGSLTCLPLCRL